MKPDSAFERSRTVGWAFLNPELLCQFRLSGFQSTSLDRFWEMGIVREFVRCDAQFRSADRGGPMNSDQTVYLTNSERLTKQRDETLLVDRCWSDWKTK
jgi:hypothetical protein